MCASGAKTCRARCVLAQRRGDVREASCSRKSRAARLSLRRAGMATHLGFPALFRIFNLLALLALFLKPFDRLPFCRQGKSVLRHYYRRRKRKFRLDNGLERRIVFGRADLFLFNEVPLLNEIGGKQSRETEVGAGANKNAAKTAMCARTTVTIAAGLVHHGLTGRNSARQ